MRSLVAPLLLASAVALAGCNTVRGVGADVESVANAFDPNTHYAACGTYGPIDRNGDGRISQAEWNDWHSGGGGPGDPNHAGPISRAEYANCWYGGGFSPAYHQTAYEPS